MCSAGLLCQLLRTADNQGIPRLIDLNASHFPGLTDYPKMTHGDIEDADLNTVGTFIKNMVDIGVLQPDSALEEYLRRIGNLPEKLDIDMP